MGTSYSRLDHCTTPWCNSGMPVTYVLEYEGKHPRHAELKHWLYSKSGNVHIYHACQFCVLRCPCANQFLAKL